MSAASNTYSVSDYSNATDCLCLNFLNATTAATAGADGKPLPAIYKLYPRQNQSCLALSKLTIFIWLADLPNEPYTTGPLPNIQAAFPKSLSSESARDQSAPQIYSRAAGGGGGGGGGTAAALKPPQAFANLQPVCLPQMVHADHESLSWNVTQQLDHQQSKHQALEHFSAV